MHPGNEWYRYCSGETKLVLVAEPVLGWQQFAGGWGSGWGTSSPPNISNGGSPSGNISNITWSGWGRSKALGHGEAPANKPSGGYYAQPVPAQLKASDLGMCHGHLGYRHLHWREAKRPGRAVAGRWHPWATQGGNICVHAFN